MQSDRTRSTTNGAKPFLPAAPARWAHFLRISVQFRAAHGATIVMSTFRATYGWLGIDITARLLEHATKTANSLSAGGVDLPVGDHKITVTIADNHGRTGSRVLRMSVAQ